MAVKIDAALAARLSPTELIELAKAYGEQEYIIVPSEKRKRRIMSPPRRPRGEKPATTIRLLQRTIDQLQQGMLNERNATHALRKKIAEQDVLLSEAQEREQITTSVVTSQGDAYGSLLAQHSHTIIRLNFLEGYYAAQQEILSGHPYPRAGQGDSGTLPHGRQAPEGTRDQAGAERDGGQAGGQIRG